MRAENSSKNRKTPFVYESAKLLKFMHPNVQCSYNITLDYLSFGMHHLGS
jgi:hypothetical protein